MRQLVTLIMAMNLAQLSIAQEIVELPHENAEGVEWENGEKEYYSKIWDNQVVTNVSIPTMEVFRPEQPNGTAVIVAPGGGLYALSIQSEGTDVAKWLNQKGITAFVLKYRLVPTGEDGVQDITDDSSPDPSKILKKVEPVLPYSVADGLAAIRHVRVNAADYSINPEKIGFMGFSAGGAVTMGVAYGYSKPDRPNFLVPVYPWTYAMPVKEVPADAPPMLVICASDDPLGLAGGSTELYASWLKAAKPVGLHMYAKGGHGFGMKQQGLPSDSWISRFYDWSVAEGITEHVGGQ
ncbi:alpha/beta hydrolase [Flavobacteriaceae bacterium TP-CH-4]|uniref:Alpha/beta hydrolase n=1 Tax=Pelagihabitans pacificus TaxID=2696054 RepID=A0A967E838_9FLAO|nr:alpha/beta hydrolase [Pelagihabitans pacificus]NHF61260.1 alpha/beta hydrolase [Pelagihabitans pacificus]